MILDPNIAPFGTLQSTWVPIQQVTTQIVSAAEDPAWFRQSSWQAGEDQADRDIAAGHLTTYESDEDFLASI